MLEKSQPSHPGKISLVDCLDQWDTGKNAEAFSHTGKISASPPRLDFIGGIFGPMRHRDERWGFLHTLEKSQPSHPGKISLVACLDQSDRGNNAEAFFHTLEKSQPPHPGKISLVDCLDQWDTGNNAEAFFTRGKNLSLPTQVRFHWWNVWTNETQGIMLRLSSQAGKISAFPPK